MLLEFFYKFIKCDRTYKTVTHHSDLVTNYNAIPLWQYVQKKNLQKIKTKYNDIIELKRPS